MDVLFCGDMRDKLKMGFEDRKTLRILQLNGNP